MTFGRALDNFDRFLDFFLSMGQVPLYEGVRRHYPELVTLVEKRLRDGRWEVVRDTGWNSRAPGRVARRWCDTVLMPSSITSVTLRLS